MGLSGGTQAKDNAAVGQIERSHVFVMRDGKLLALQQAGSWRWWEQPGGTLEDGEEAAGAAVRETFEETGLHIEAPELLRTWSYRDGRGDVVGCHMYVAEAPTGDVRLSAEHTDYAWFDVDEYGDRYCGERLAEAVPQAANFLLGMRQNLDLLRAWTARRTAGS